jgi:multiple sugar transport system permease protein
MATLAAARPASESRARSRSYKHLRKNILVYSGLTFFSVLAGLPVFWMVITTFKADRDLYNLKNFPLWFNQAPTLDHLDLLFHKTQFGHWLVNTLIVAVAVVLITWAVAVPAGYALARLHFPGSEAMSIGVFLTYLVPTTLLFLPLVKVVAGLGLFDKLGALIVAYPTFTIPFCTWLMAGFFRTIPQEIEEAAMVDGCSRIGAIPRVVLPLSVAGMLTVAIFAFTLSMQDFVYALSFVSSSDQKVVTIGVVTELIRGDVFFWGSLMAGALLAGLPVAILYSFFLDYFVKGITGGAVK